jgi:uncharacterized membrane protein YfhO
VIVYENSWVKVHANAEKSGLLILSDLYYPGWQATVDGKQVQLLRINYIMRGVPLPAGEHIVEFKFRPQSLVLGLMISSSGLIGLICLLLVDQSSWMAAWRTRLAQGKNVDVYPNR